MNFAFPALLIVILVSPGVILRYSYLKGNWERSFEGSSVTRDLLLGAILAALLHALWISLSSCLGYSVHVDSVLALLCLPKEAGLVEKAVERTTQRAELVLTYFGTLFAFAALLGHLANRVVRACRLDHKFRPLRFNNEWFYLLSGEQVMLDGESRDPPDLTYVSAVIEQGSEAHLYCGWLTRFFLDADGRLDRVVIRDAVRRRLQADRPQGTRHVTGGGEDYYSIAGNYFVIDYAHTKTLNLEYVWLESEEQEEDEDSP